MTISNEPRDNNDLPEHRVAMVVLTTVRAVDAIDAGHIADRAIRRALRTSSVEAPVLTVMCRTPTAEIPVQIHQVMDLGVAGGNGYVWIQPTGKAYPRKEEDR